MKEECQPVDSPSKDVSNHNELELTVQSLLICLEQPQSLSVK